jgi:hypothetical protein
VLVNLACVFTQGFVLLLSALQPACANGECGMCLQLTCICWPASLASTASTIMGKSPMLLLLIIALLQVASVDLRKGGLVLKPSSKKAAEEEAAAAAAADAAAADAAAAADPWGGIAVGAQLPEGAVVQQVLLRPAEQGGGLVELTVTGGRARV